MIIESGVIIFFGLMFIFIKLPKKTALRLLNYPLTLDVFVSVLAFAMHYGTFSGVMAAAVAGLMCSGFTTCARYIFGRIDNGKYIQGVVKLKLD
jgi:NhaP-type Na+/H+ or K+/H+ antiporter